MPWHTIREIARLLGRPESTVRSWRDRYRPFVPERTDPGGRRLYDSDVLTEIQTLQGQHLTPREIRVILSRHLGAEGDLAGGPATIEQVLAELRALREQVDWLVEREKARSE